MALQKDISVNNINVSYWKISGLNVSYTGEMAQIFVMGFANAEARNSGLDKKIAFENYIVKGEDFKTYFATEVLDVVNVNPINSAYKYLKEKEGVFIGSIDV